MKLSEAIREWKRNITTHMAIEYVLTLRADINAFSDAVQALERENAKLRRFVTLRNHCLAGGCDLCQYRKNRESEDVECELDDLRRELGI